jgi:hypothetical protein
MDNNNQTQQMKTALEVLLTELQTLTPTSNE